MADPEIIKLKKEIHHLKELNSLLQQDNEEKNYKIGELQNQINNVKNRTLLAEEAKLIQNKETMRKNIEEALIEEKSKMDDILKENQQLKETLIFHEKQKKDFELFIEKIQKEKNEIKKQLTEFGRKHEATDFIDNIRMREDALIKKEQDYQKIILQWNELRDRMEEVLSENRLLRQIADVPENFGIDITKIKMGDRIKIEDYKAKIRILQREIDDLESERAHLKSQLVFLGNTVQVNEPPFNKLTSEQKVEVARYAQCLYEGTEVIPPTIYELLKEGSLLKQKIELLEDQNSKSRYENSLRLPGMTAGFSGSKGGQSNNDIRDMLIALKNENAELKQLLKNNLDKFSSFDPNKVNIIQNSNETGYSYSKRPDRSININPNQERYDTSNFTYLQLPPVPLIDPINIDNTTHGQSYRFNSKYKISKDQIHQLFGIATNEANPEDLKIESASLQCQMIELMEIITRMKQDDESFNVNIQSIYNSLENLVLIQNELFERYYNDRKKNILDYEKNAKANNDLLNEITSVKRINKAYEETINIVERKNLSEIERKMIEKMKENAIIENINIKLQRKYECLVEEEQKQREYIDLTEKNSIEKDNQMQGTIAKLKEWKSILMFYLKFLVKKLKVSVSKEEFDKIAEENKYMREKYNEVTLKDISITKVMAINQTLKIKLRDIENNYYESNEVKLGLEIEINYLKKHLQEIDPQYYNEQKAFRRFATRITDQKISFEDVRKAFSPNNKDEITKNEFKEGLSRLGLSEYCDNINQSLEVDLILHALHLDEEQKIEVRYLMRLIEQNCIDEAKDIANDNKVFEDFIDCVRTSSRSLISIFEYFDQNNNGKITREEFKFALQELKFPVSDEIIYKLIIIVSGNENEPKTDLDTFNYIEFCDLFDQKSKSYLLRKKRNNQTKNNIKIDWKLNCFSIILEAMKPCRLTTENAFRDLDKTKTGFLCFDEFGIFVRSLNTRLNTSDLIELFHLLDPQNTTFIPIDILKEALNDTEKKVESYKMMSNPQGYKNEARTVVDLNRKYYMLLEEKNHFNYKISQLKMRYEDLERNNKETTNELDNYVSKNTELVDKYFSTMKELQQLQEIYASTGVKKDDMHRIENENDLLTREVTVLRIGMNTFKELYNSSNRQIKMISMKQTKNFDELETYKRAVKELQSVNNQNALIGKLYYSLLISRWREANSLRKYDDFVSDFSSMKEDNFQLETMNKVLTKDVTEIQASLHEKIIENIRINDQLENYIHGFVGMKADEKNRPLEEMKKLVKLLSQDKSDMTESIITLKKSVLRLENQNAHLQNTSDHYYNLTEKVKNSNTDDYSKKIIAMCEEISGMRINLGSITRENNYFKENNTHLQKLNTQLNDEIKEIEISSAAWENKCRQMEEIYRTKDDERQRKLIESLEKLKIYQPDELQSILKGQALRNTQNKDLNPQQAQFALEAKIKELSSIIAIKDGEIESLSKLQNENIKSKQDASKFYDVNSLQNLVGPSGYDIMKDDETRLIAQTAHKTIKTLQEMLSSKNDALRRKDAEIGMLHDDNNKMKEYYLKLVNSLQDQIHSDHNATLKKLNNVLDMANSNISHKFSRNDLSLMTVNEIEKLILDKDNAIKALGFELRSKNNENEVNYMKINELNKRIADLQVDNKEREMMRRNNDDNEELDKLKKVLAQKTVEINEEKQKIQRLTMEFQKKYEDRTLLEEEKLDNTVVVPEKLIINKEKSDLFVKINQLRKQNKAFTKERDDLKNIIKEKDQIISDLNIKVDKGRKLYTDTLDLQSRDTKTISALRKKEEKLREEIEKLKANEVKNSQNAQVKEQPKESPKQSYLQKNIHKKQDSSVQQSYLQKYTQKEQDESSQLQPSYLQKHLAKEQDESPESQPSYLQKHLPKEQDAQGIDKKPSKEIIQQSQISYNPKSDDDVLLKLVYYCIKKNINMTKQLQRYNISKNGNVTTEDFQKSIEELKFGFIDYDIKQLILSTHPVNGFISINGFVQMMKDKDSNYAAFMKEQEDNVIGDKKLVTKKYNPFENKSFNINY